ncbi:MULTISPECIES: hypothetical protein [Virgibacillus]|uniref:hypothetical protein n=1 Tax=Virgibacillus TaxID=84406 RepID=UPI00067C7AFE|nr:MULTISPECIES: hypothetical protein [Virgibacillus]MBS7429390.1 ABC transporter [Virgibacillus sp. 19R1-5]MBU8568093.1 ABC transporter [Virgibacillus pantothenticus]MBU8602039.1 ABC transporter [Virgibacillus pantothenticus]MBU8636289.1 ABC transporter [Virgibacillus pantothenticus]MBU8643809.1 ABC transporter [Virgibacillus pantothenticus]
MEQKLLNIFENWEAELDQNEWYFRESFEELTEGLSAEEAFNAIPKICSVILKLNNSFLIGETIDFLHEIYNVADTTEIHSFLHEHLDEIQKHINQYSDDFGKNAFNGFKELIRLY